MRRPRALPRELSDGGELDFELLDLLFGEFEVGVSIGRVEYLAGTRSGGAELDCSFRTWAGRPSLEMETGIGGMPDFSTIGVFPSGSGAGPRGLCGADAELPSSDSISDSKDFDEEDGVMRIRKFFAEWERETRRELGRRARSDRLLCWRSAERRGRISGDASFTGSGEAGGWATLGGRASCNEAEEGRRHGERVGAVDTPTPAGERRRRASSDHSWS